MIKVGDIVRVTDNVGSIWASFNRTDVNDPWLGFGSIPKYKLGDPLKVTNVESVGMHYNFVGVSSNGIMYGFTTYDTTVIVDQSTLFNEFYAKV